MVKKRKYTIKKNRPIVKCITCGKSHVEGEKCPYCENPIRKVLKYPQDVPEKGVRIGLWQVDNEEK